MIVDRLQAGAVRRSAGGTVHEEKTVRAAGRIKLFMVAQKQTESDTRSETPAHPKPEQSKAAVLNTLKSSVHSRRSYYSPSTGSSHGTVVNQVPTFNRGGCCAVPVVLGRS